MSSKAECVIHHVWEDHFECGFWIGDYNGKVDYSNGLKIISCRIRNNFADGVNFCQGTSNATVYNCSVRNNGDDGLAMWNDHTMGAVDEKNNTSLTIPLNLSGVQAVLPSMVVMVIRFITTILLICSWLRVFI